MTDKPPAKQPLLRLGELHRQRQNELQTARGKIAPSPAIFVEKAKVRDRQALLALWAARRDVWRDQVLDIMVESSAAVSGVMAANEIAADNLDSKLEFDSEMFTSQLISVIKACALQKLMDHFQLNEMQQKKVSDILSAAPKTQDSMPSYIARLLAHTQQGELQNPFGNSKNIKSVSRSGKT